MKAIRQRVMVILYTVTSTAFLILETAPRLKQVLTVCPSTRFASRRALQPAGGSGAMRGYANYPRLGRHSVCPVPCDGVRGGTKRRGLPRKNLGCAARGGESFSRSGLGERGSTTGYRLSRKTGRTAPHAFWICLSMSHWCR